MLQLRLLGPPEISLDNLSVVETLATKAQAILYYLAVHHPSGQPRSTLATLLWGDVPDDAARTNLRKALSNLREKVGDYLDLDGQTIAFRADCRLWIDVVDFKGGIEAAGAAGDIKRLQEAVALYRADFLSGYYVRHAPDFENWMLAEQARLREMVIQGLHTLAVHYAGAGELAQSITYTRRLLNLEPWREEAHRLLMLLLARAGQHSSALAQFEICRRVLTDELGVEPGPETRALYQRLRSEERVEDRGLKIEDRGGSTVLSSGFSPRPPAFVPRHNLPAQLTPFVGRQRELADIIRRLMDRDCRLLTLVGLGGIGKTRTALQVAQTIIDLDPEVNLFTDGVFFVPLAAVSSHNGFIAAIADAVSFTVYSHVSPKQQLLDHLRKKKLLLLLDNFEHLLESSDLIADIVAAAPEVKVLVTSREALNLEIAWFHPLDGLSFPASQIAEGGGQRLDTYDAVRLFVQSAQRARVQFSLAAEQAHVVRICQLVEGMPLGIELAAAWLKVLPAEKVAAEIEHNLDILSTRLQNIPERQRSMRAVFEYSWQRLSEEEHKVLKRLSVFQGGFQQEAAEQVAGASLLSLAMLVEKSLVQVTELGRYQMHELLRQFAAEKLAQTPSEREAALDAHCRYYAMFLSEREFWKVPDNQRLTAWNELRAEFDNLRAGWQRAIVPGRSVALIELNQCIWLMSSLYVWRGWFQEGVALLEQAAARLEEDRTITPFTPLQKLVYGRLLLGQGYFYYLLNQLQQAITLYGQGLAAVHESEAADWPNSQRYQAVAYYNLGLTQWRQSRYAEAEKSLILGLSLSRLINDRIYEARSLACLSIVTYELGEDARAEQFLAEGLLAFKKLGTFWGADDLSHLTQVTYALNKPLTDIRLLLEAYLRLSREVKNTWMTVNALNFLGATLQRMGQIECIEARRLLQESVALCRGLFTPASMVTALYQLGLTHTTLNEYRAALACFREALEVSLSANLTPLILETLLGLTAILIKPELFRPERQAHLLALLNLVVSHPASTRQIRTYAARLLAEVEKRGPSPGEVTAAQAPADHSQALTEMTKEILRWLTDRGGL